MEYKSFKLRRLSNERERGERASINALACIVCVENLAQLLKTIFYVLPHELRVLRPLLCICCFMAAATCRVFLTVKYFYFASVTTSSHVVEHLIFINSFIFNDNFLCRE